MNVGALSPRPGPWNSVIECVANNPRGRRGPISFCVTGLTNQDLLALNFRLLKLRTILPKLSGHKQISGGSEAIGQPR
jgi:hypothetical protein